MNILLLAQFKPEPRRFELSLSYAEGLPHQCPPEDAVDGPLEAVYRLVANQTPTPQDFASKAALGDTCPLDTDECNWSSCSLSKRAKSLLKYKRLKVEKPFIVTLVIPIGVGRHKLGDSKRGHLDFWRYSGHCLTTFVQKVEGANDDG